MNYCYVEFIPKDEESLRRTTELFEMLKNAKEEEEALNIECFNEGERSYFWNPSAEELKEWNDEWFLRL